MIKRIIKSLFIVITTLLLILIVLIKRPTFISYVRESADLGVKPENLKQHVKFLSQEIKDRSYQANGGLMAASDYIESQFMLYHDNVSLQPYQINGQTYQNVIATHGEDDAPILVVGAHYDSFGSLPGADDNASGVAGLLELNRLLASDVDQAQLNKQIMLVAYTLEEPPIYATNKMGSVIHAESLLGKDVELMISLEMIGYFNDNPDSQGYPLSALGLIYPNSGHFITVVDQLFSTAGPKLKKTFNQLGLIEAYSINAPSAIPGIDFSDHRSYWALDIPAIMITDTSFYRNPNYHTAGDTFDTLDFQKMSYVVSGVLAHIKRMAQ